MRDGHYDWTVPSNEPLQAGEQYELWRNDSLDFLSKLAR
jgi:hypothetical protein